MWGVISGTLRYKPAKQYRVQIPSPFFYLFFQRRKRMFIFSPRFPKFPLGVLSKSWLKISQSPPAISSLILSLVNDPFFQLLSTETVEMWSFFFQKTEKEKKKKLRWRRLSTRLNGVKNWVGDGFCHIKKGNTPSPLLHAACHGITHGFVGNLIDLFPSRSQAKNSK